MVGAESTLWTHLPKHTGGRRGNVAKSCHFNTTVFSTFLVTSTNHACAAPPRIDPPVRRSPVEAGHDFLIGLARHTSLPCSSNRRQGAFNSPPRPGREDRVFLTCGARRRSLWLLTIRAIETRSPRAAGSRARAAKPPKKSRASRGALEESYQPRAGRSRSGVAAGPGREKRVLRAGPSGAGDLLGK
ncbi:unnamed protein product [Lepidochelys olivacea]